MTGDELGPFALVSVAVGALLVLGALVGRLIADGGSAAVLRALGAS